MMRALRAHVDPTAPTSPEDRPSSGIVGVSPPGGTSPDRTPNRNGNLSQPRVPTNGGMLFTVTVLPPFAARGNAKQKSAEHIILRHAPWRGCVGCPRRTAQDGDVIRQHCTARPSHGCNTRHLRHIDDVIGAGLHSRRLNRHLAPRPRKPPPKKNPKREKPPPPPPPPNKTPPPPHPEKKEPPHPPTPPPPPRITGRRCFTSRCCASPFRRLGPRGSGDRRVNFVHQRGSDVLQAPPRITFRVDGRISFSFNRSPAPPPPRDPGC